MADVESLSDYAKLRLDKIRRNEQKLKQLGLTKTVCKPSTNQKQRTKTVKTCDASFQPPRRSSRKRKAFRYEEDDNTDNDTDYESSCSYDGKSDDEELEDEKVYLTGRKKNRKIPIEGVDKIKKIVTPNSPSATPQALTDILTCEFAKTGRSSCRKCGNKIEKGASRVGMRAWIVGRQAITWQCTICFLRNIVCSYEKSGRSRCKLTNKTIAKGELKIGARSHTATSFFTFDTFSIVLGYVTPWMNCPTELKGEILTVEQIEGNEALTMLDRSKVQSLLSTFSSTVQTSGTIARFKDAENQDKANLSSPHSKLSASETKVGKNIRSRGKVEWKFGGHTCFGTLLPSKETHTHCYARTHKGNVKTLAKGKDYWSICA